MQALLVAGCTGQRSPWTVALGGTLSRPGTCDTNTLLSHDASAVDVDGLSCRFRAELGTLLGSSRVVAGPRAWRWYVSTVPRYAFGVWCFVVREGRCGSPAGLRDLVSTKQQAADRAFQQSQLL
jgi:hypothetical protein